MAREIVTSENRDEYIAKKMAEKAGKSVEDKEDELKSLALGFSLSFGLTGVDFSF